MRRSQRAATGCSVNIWAHTHVDTVKSHLPQPLRTAGFRLLTYYVECHMRRSLAPLLLADGQPQQQGSPVAPARRSASAQAKARTRRTPYGLAVQSFHDLLKDVATIVKNRIRP